MRLIFAGTPDFAAVALEALIRAGHEIALVLSQPDRPSGRGMKLTASPVKTLALQHGLPVLTPQTLSLKRDPEGAAAVYETLRNLEADVLIVAAYGLILPAPVLECAKGIGRDRDIRAINIHGSLLPRWRGAAPVARAIEAGDAETGVTLMKMELGLDTGPMISVRSTPITKEDTNATLMDRIAHIGADLLVEALEHPYDLTWTPQPEEGVVYAEKLQKSEGRIDWTQSAEVIARRIRAFTPFPSVYFVHGDLNVKVWEAEPVAGEGAPGTVLSVKDGLTIACGEGALRATVLQRPGKPRMPAESFLQSLPIEVNEVLA
jgi:methionyl-tRNA formyltransferase